jgi:hypothetical protein
MYPVDLVEVNVSHFFWLFMEGTTFISTGKGKVTRFEYDEYRQSMLV